MHELSGALQAMSQLEVLSIECLRNAWEDTISGKCKLYIKTVYVISTLLKVSNLL